PHYEMVNKHLQTLIDQESGGAPKGKVWSDTLGGYVTPQQKYNADVKASPEYSLFHETGMRPAELYPPSTTKTTPAASGFFGIGAHPATTEVIPGVKRGRYEKDPATNQVIWKD